MASAIAVTADQTYARIGVTLTGFPSDDPVSVYRRPADGSGTPVPVRGASPMNIISGTGFQWDYEAVSGVTYVYTANDGATDITSGTVSITLAEAHLVAVGRPAFNTQVLPEAIPATTRKARSTLADVIGRANPVALTDLRAGLSGSITLITVDDEESDRLEQVLIEAQVVFLQLPDSRFGARYVLVGDVTESPFTGIRGANEGALWELDITEVDRPGGDVSGDPTVSYQLLKDEVQSYSALLIAAPNYLGLRSGIGLDPDVSVPQYIGPFSATGATAVATLPAFVSGDLGVALVALADSTKTFTLPSGWTQLGTDLISGAGRYALVYKTLAADTTVTLGASGATNRLVVGAIYRNAKVNTTATTRVGGASSSVTATAPAATSVKAGTQALRLFAAMSATANASWSTPALTNLRTSILGTGSTSLSGLAVDRGTGQPGAISAVTSNRSLASSSFAGWTVVIETP